MKRQTQPGPEAPLPPQKARWAAFLVAPFVAAILALLHRSWKSEVVGLDLLEDRLRAGERVLVLFWHGKYVPFFTLLRGRGACIFASRSLRGEVICALCRLFGHHCLTLPEHAPGEGQRLLREALAGQTLAALVPDGPRGPYHQVKPGLIRLAAELGMTLLPASAAASRRHRAAGRWDRMELPLPFSRVRLVFGAPIAVPPDFGGQPVGWWQQQVAEALEAAGARAEASLEGDGGVWR